VRKDVRAHWREDRWVVDTEVGLSAAALKSIADFTRTVQKQRYAALPPGDVRDECGRTIKALDDGRIAQNIAGVGDRVLFDAYKSDKIIVGA
jgi:hypothetical protein